ncbi:hypothetical protein AMS68_007173 [Peltaster fructicola]|uniref:Deacetylase sirtuin-type domain-containing protein n=1 Tax=Peltaster fructicola TaxID=286661 RepID=A0A6H0Y3X5_9PEZI|nr:hypothetical protein AMS68_007173 [Peltaster fructicola]
MDTEGGASQSLSQPSNSTHPSGVDNDIVAAELELSSTVKRKRGDSTNSFEGDLTLAAHAELSPAVASDDDDGGIDEGSLEEVDIDDLVENLAHNARDNDLVALSTPAEVRSKILNVGITTFVNDLLTQTGKTAVQLGAELGLAADLLEDEEMYMYLLERIVVSSMTRRRKLQQYNTIDDAAHLISKSKNIMVITGAGISTSLGIPDFRSKHTGFYSKLQEMGFSEPEDVFDIHIFDEQPEIFYSLAGDILPKGKEYTPTHGFIRLLQDHDRLQTNYTQNIDNLEANAGLDPAKIIQCHGSFATASCRLCKHQVPGEDIFDDLRAKKVSLCKLCIERIAIEAQTVKPATKKIKFDADTSEGEDDNIPTPGVMKPDITFFGEQLPNTFFERFQEEDSHTADLVIVIGTSLKVAPVADMPNHMPESTPHIFISREPCEHIRFDIQLLGDCDAVCWELSRRAGLQLKHSMIPEDFSVEVRAAGDSGHHWTITNALDADKDTAHSSAEKLDAR